MAESPKREIALERVYVWELPVRLTHWALFFSILVLSATGYYIGHPFISVPEPAKDHFVMGTVRTIHLCAAIAFTLSVLARIYWMFAGNAYASLLELIPLSGRRWRSLWKTALFFAFIRRDPDDYEGHNGLGGASYAAVFAVYLLMIATGLALYSVVVAAGSPFRFFSFLVPLLYGLQFARLIHHIGMWVVLIFAVVHVYFVLLSSVIDHVGTVDSIFSGFKFIPKRRRGAS